MQVPPPWGNRSFADVLKNEDKKPDAISSLYELPGENKLDYFKRIYSIYKKTTCHATYGVYICKYGNKKYTVAARHEIIVKLLCRLEESRLHIAMHKEKYLQFKHELLDLMYDDNSIWDDVMSRVDGDPAREDEAIRAYYKPRQYKNEHPVWWLGGLVTCKKTNDTMLCAEKILR